VQWRRDRVLLRLPITLPAHHAAVHSLNGTERYVYDPSNERVWKQEPSRTLVFFYGVEGNLLATYGDESNTDYNVYFGAKLVWAEASPGIAAGPVALDRLGSSVRHFPYGREPVDTGLDRVKFATYYRDQTTIFDYARNRYYARTTGRFTTPDPYRPSGGPADPQSWNRYAYVQNDPVNYHDPAGLFMQTPCLIGHHRGQNGNCVPDWVDVPGHYPGIPGIFVRTVPGDDQQPTNEGSSGSDWTGILGVSGSVMGILEEALSKSSCRGIFGNGADPLQVLEDAIAGNGTALTGLTTAKLDESRVAETRWGPQVLAPGTSDWVISSAQIVVSWAGPWFNGFQADRSVYGNYSDDQFKAETLIHELGHVYAVVVGLGGFLLPFHSDTDSTAYDMEIFTACFGPPPGAP
jgi:RHS repeat-associated protein